MEKVTIKAEMIPEIKWVKIGETNDGQDILCRNWIPYSEKEALAVALASIALYENEVEEVCFENYKYPLFECVLQTLYYTNLVADSEAIERSVSEDIFDYVVSTGVYDKMLEVIENDLPFIYEIYDKAIEASKALFNNEHSLSTKIKTAFGSILNGEDITDTLAKSEEASASMEELLKAFNAVGTVTKKPDKIPIKDGVLNIGGTKLDQRKKEI